MHSKQFHANPNSYFLMFPTLRPPSHTPPLSTCPKRPGKRLFSLFRQSQSHEIRIKFCPYSLEIFLVSHIPPYPSASSILQKMNKNAFVREWINYSEFLLISTRPGAGAHGGDSPHRQDSQFAVQFVGFDYKITKLRVRNEKFRNQNEACELRAHTKQPKPRGLTPEQQKGKHSGGKLNKGRSRLTPWPPTFPSLLSAFQCYSCSNGSVLSAGRSGC